MSEMKLKHYVADIVREVTAYEYARHWLSAPADATAEEIEAAFLALTSTLNPF
jgi:hypothetical protein